ncbi:NAD-dependent epimerase/dehydratase family protein [Clostridium folliculivorans]|uniref:UDP-glucose 4-epimerase n=1 Tax=Clostridium folliculivorans TaxID=2886038 RepID=A0A9W5Y202_9CLOT|nr:NAD-dependent epimerase/dehydratase family protein [Clostridium folliculivorans]GKU25103.1 epimerase [Clostridium folliculivorans]GKU31201.1 epimerase [Clostridium folliculivorans]
MKVLVIGGTRFFGVHLVNSLLSRGHKVTIATRGNAKDVFGDKVERIIIERNDPSNLKETIGGDYYDVVFDNIAYCSNDVKGLLSSLKCGRYIMTSSASVYTNQHIQTSESEFDPISYPLKWCFREDFPYNEAKRQAESALFQIYPQFGSVAVRLPYVIGEDDYTKRLYFYVEQIIKGNSINVDNLNEKIGFIDSAEAGDFLAWIAEQNFVGAINGNSNGTISLKEIIEYVELKTNKKAIYSSEGLEGPYNGQKSFDLDVIHANKLGYCFTDLNSWIYKLLDKYIRTLEANI